MHKSEQAKAYLADFIRTKGGPEAVAKVTGMNRQTVRQIAEGRNGASQKTLSIFIEHFPDFDLTLSYSTVTATMTRVTPSAQLSPSQDGTDWKARFDALENKYDTLLTDYRTLLGKYESLMDRAIKKLELSFSSAASPFTVCTSTEPIGFKTYTSPADTVTTTAIPKQWNMTVHRTEPDIFLQSQERRA